jgi:hypothetical protein
MNRNETVAPLIVIEGPEKSGKTTLARAIGVAGAPAVLLRCDRHGDDPVHRPFNERLMMEYYGQILAAAMKARETGKAAILDGHWLRHVAEGAAGETLRAGALFNFRGQFEPYLNALGVFYVFAIDPRSIEIALANPDPENPRDRMHLEKVLSAYTFEQQLLWTRPDPRCIAYHWSVHGATAKNLDDFARLVLSLAAAPAPKPVRNGSDHSTSSPF